MPGWLTWTSRRTRKPGLSPEIEAALKKLGVRHYDEDLLDMPHDWLRAQFPRDSKRILKELYFRNVIWQLHEKIQAATTPEERPDFYNKRGFIRGMWYHIKPRVDHMPEFQGDQAGRITEALGELVEAGVLSYSDFNFRDKNEGDRKLGQENPHIILVAEKDGFFALMEDLHAGYGCHVITLGGNPGLLSVNFFVSDLVKAGVDPTQEFVCLAIVDYDPQGDEMMRTFARQLQVSGVKNLRPFRQYPRRPTPDRRLDLVRPENLPPDVSIRKVRYILPKSERTLPWGVETGGAAGREYGLESDEFREAHLKELVETSVHPFLRVGADVVRKRVQLRALAQSLTAFAAYKMTHQPAVPPPKSAASARRRPLRPPPPDRRKPQGR